MRKSLSAVAFRDIVSLVAPRILIAGVSTRAAAESAARAGFEVTALDAYADMDQHPAVRALSVTRDFGLRYSAAAIARVSRSLDAGIVVYLSSFENHCRAIADMSAGRVLWGNPPAVVRRVRDPFVLASELARRGFPVPAVRRPGSAADHAALRRPGSAAGHAALRRPGSAAGHAALRRPGSAAGHAALRRPGSAADVSCGRPGDSARTPDDSYGDATRWLIKPRASGGGHGVRAWTGSPIPRGCYLQEQIDGVPASIVFVAWRGRATPLAMSRQLIGDEAFGASGYRYCGSIIDAADARFGAGSPMFAAASALASAAAEAFDLVGVNGIDVIARDDVPYPIEINPRWSSSMELVERATGLSVFAAHAAACTSALSTLNDLRPHFRRAIGKAIVFAREAVRIGDPRAWLEDPDVRDVPHPGERIAAGRPVCTVFASGADAEACHIALVRKADSIYEQLGRWTREAA
jgi:predicted ATP-grasp superfamily ATP-dependent carboligase